jgi:hypothetical protein
VAINDRYVKAKAKADRLERSLGQEVCKFHVSSFRFGGVGGLDPLKIYVLL